MVFTTLAHHVDVILLKEAFHLTRKDGASGVDQQTAAEYEEQLDKNLTSLLDRFKSGTYKGSSGQAGVYPQGKRGRPPDRHPDH